MKAKVMTEKKEFQPVKLELRIETLQDLQWLLAIADASFTEAKRVSGDYLVDDYKLYNHSQMTFYNHSQMTFYNAINAIYKEYVNG